MSKQTEPRTDTPAISMRAVFEQVASYIEPDPQLWAALVQQIALHAHSEIPGGSLPDHAALDARIERLIAPSSRAERSALIDGAAAIAFEAVEFGARLGFALARTWPDTAEGFADWPAAAWRYAEMGDWIARQRQASAETAAYWAKRQAEDAKRAADRAARQDRQPEPGPDAA